MYPVNVLCLLKDDNARRVARECGEIGRVESGTDGCVFLQQIIYWTT